MTGRQIEAAQRLEESRADQHCEVIDEVLYRDGFPQSRVISFVLKSSVERNQKQAGGETRDDEQRNGQKQAGVAADDAQKKDADRHDKTIAPHPTKFSDLVELAREKTPGDDARDQTDLEQREFLVRDFGHPCCRKAGKAPALEVAA